MKPTFWVRSYAVTEKYFEVFTWTFADLKKEKNYCFSILFKTRNSEVYVSFMEMERISDIYRYTLYGITVIIKPGRVEVDDDRNTATLEEGATFILPKF